MADRKMTLRERARAWWRANGRSFDEALPPGEQGYLAGWHARGRADRQKKARPVYSVTLPNPHGDKGAKIIGPGIRQCTKCGGCSPAYAGRPTHKRTCPIVKAVRAKGMK